MTSERFPFSGEFFDLTLTSYNNNFGRDKIIYSLHHGIEIPMQKYINELEEIAKTSRDDKSYKRSLRLKFLKECNEHDYLQKYFEILLGWLNGGGDRTSYKFIPGAFNSAQYKSQKLILTISGGNIYIIFARLLANIKWASQQPQTSQDPLSIITNIFDNLTTTNKNILDQQENETDGLINKLDILYDIITILADDSPLITLINELLSNSGNFSDFDYNLLPNKNPTFDT